MNSSEAAPERASIQAVVFDIGRVLIEWRLAGIYDSLIEDEARRDWFLRHVVTEDWHALHDAGVPLSAMIAARSAAFPQEAELIAAYGTRWLDSLPGPVPGMPALVERLALAGVPLFAITNFGVDTWAMFRPTFPVLDHMRDIVVSGHERLVKPDPAIFHLAAERFGHAPGAMLFIDDNAANIAAAAALGWQTHHFVQGAEALERELVARGVL